jgi:hypothetical protein
MSDIFESAERKGGDLSGVFESDDETSYFYLYQSNESDGQKVLDSMHVFSGEPDFIEADISIRWDTSDQKVGLFIRGVMWAVFDVAGQTKLGGNYGHSKNPSLPPHAHIGFDS